MARGGRTSLLVSRLVAVFFLAGTALYTLQHRSPIAIPDQAPQQHFSDKDFIVAATDAIREKVALLVTVSLGLAALVGFAFKDGWGKKFLQKMANPVLLSLFIYFLVRVIVCAFDTYGMISVQLEQSHFYLVVLDENIVTQARSTFATAVLGSLILFFNLLAAGD